MGTGKTSVGREISRKLGYRFIDTDVLIEEREGMPISVIFKNRGEDYFRKLEQDVVAVVSREKDVVIATGGGVIKNRTNVENLRRRGVLIWLKASPEIILKRIMTEGGKRPLLDVDEPLHEINKLLEERMELYKQGDMSIDTDYITPEEAAEEIIEKLALDSKAVTVGLEERSYEIVIGTGTIKKLGVRVKELRPSRVAVISNRTVFPLYKDAVLGSLREHDMEPVVVLMPDGEEYKDFEWVNKLHGELLKAGLDRSSVLIALGGGVIGDIAGFVASTYMRGIRFVQVPTTLLAQVDSSVGGKTGVNHPLGKNMIGTFYQPSLVLVDIDTLRTLPQREFYAGMAEVIKYGIIADSELFDFLLVNRDGIITHGDAVVHIIKRSCEIKADVVSKDERESGLRAILNYGHTVGHAVETVTGYTKYLHGEAVAIGMYAAAKLAVITGMLDKKELEAIKDIIRLYELPVDMPGDLAVDDIISAMEMDKKARAGKLSFILPESTGRVKIVEDVDRNLVRQALAE